MATKKVLIQVILNDKASQKAKKTGDAIEGLSSKVLILNEEQRQQIINDEKSAIQKKNLINELKAQAAAEMNVVAAQKQGRAQSGLNNAILLETGRLASDASYGFTAMANNLGQIVTLFSSFVETNDGVVASFRELGKSLWGMGGILIGVQLLISFGPKIIDRLTGMDEAAKKAAESNKQLANSLNDLGANILIAEEYLEIIEDTNTTEKERKNIIKELIKLIPDLAEEDFKYGDNLDLVREKIDEYAIAQAARIEIDKLVEDNSEVLAKRRRIRNIQDIEDEKEREEALTQFLIDNNQRLTIAEDVAFTKGDKAIISSRKMTFSELTQAFDDYTKTVVDDSNKVLDKIRELTGTSFLGGKDDAGKGLKDKYDKEFDELTKFIAKQEELEQNYFDSLLSQEQVEVNQVRDKYFKFIKLAEDFGFSTKFLEKARDAEIAGVRKKFRDEELAEEEKKQRALQKIRDKYQLGKLKIEEDIAEDPETLDELEILEQKQLARIDKEEELAKLSLDKLKLTTEEKEKAVTDIEAYYDAVRLKNAEDNQKAKEKIDELETKSKLQALDNIGKGLMAASQIAGQSTGVGKALAVAGTMISTYSAAQKAYESQMQLTPDSPIRAKIAYAAAVVQGLANVKSIMSVKTPAMKETSAVTGGTGPINVAAPDFNVVGQGGVNQLGQVIGARFGQPIRAYVVSGDISSAQELERSITAGARLD